ncbi:MAG TPA: TonB-dependent receptor plug domain-containing protein [Chryseolinea sp.]|nr:TonB-dependent receptor plug domain-containing protein [Chryseolinea sp.]
MKWLLPILFFAALSPVAAQTQPEDDFLSQEYFIKKVTKATEQFNAHHPTEKVYVHFDRPFYLLGDTAWFNIYVADSQMVPVSNSPSVFVDWFFQDGSLVRHQQFRLADGRASGSFPFLDRREGTYLVRAYTKLIADRDEDFLYARELELINLSIPSVHKNSQPAITDHADIQFFPEGGSLVEGLESKIAFKAIDSNGKGVDVTGQVMDESNETLIAFKSTYKGMGSFMLKPMKGKNYHVVWGNKAFSLPKALTSGAVLLVDNADPDFVEVTIRVSEEMLPGKFYMIGQAANKICFRDMFTLSEPDIVLQVPKKSVSGGILQLTLFDEDSKPLCERVVFPNQKIDMQVNISFNKKEYASRDLVSVAIVVKDKHGNPIQARMSVAVTDASLAKRELSAPNIHTQLLLESDLKGRIEDPGWYFESVSPEKVGALDLVMLTHGWRKLIWSQILTEQPAHPYVPAEGLPVAGRLISTEKEKPVPGADITLITYLDNKSKVYVATADDEGNFKIDDLIFNDSTRFVWQIRNKKGGQINARVVFTTPALPSIDSSRFESSKMRQFPPADLVSQLQVTGAWDFYRLKILEEVEIRGAKIEMQQQSSSGIVPENYRRHSLKLSEAESLNYTDVTKMIKDKFPNVTFIGAGINQDVRIRGYNKVLMKEEMPPLILLDGQVISVDGSHQGGVYHALNVIPVAEIEKIEVMSGAAASIYGARGGSGVIAIYSKGRSGRAVFEETSPGKGILKVVPPGYEWSKEFYQPRYLDRDNPSTPDYRMTLYWNPDVKTDETGRARIEFYNSDIARTFQLVTEGMTKTGPVVGVK